MSVLLAMWQGLLGVFSTLADAFRWAFRPANRFKALALVMGIAASVALVRLIDARNTIVVVTERANTEKVKSLAQIEALTFERDDWKKKFNLIVSENAETQRANAKAYAEARAENAEAMDKVRADTKRAAQSADKQIKVIQNQDAACKAALESLNTYCPAGLL